MNKKELIYILALQRAPNIGDITAKKLLQKLGSAEAIFKTPKKQLLAIDGIGEKTVELLNFDSYEKEVNDELQFIEEQNISTYHFQEQNYPENLKHCIDAPILLFSKGNIDFSNNKIISIVGTRRATNHGLNFCEQLVEEISALNPIIVSGFAFGIDICAHKAALNNNLQTIACLAHGLNQIYPRQHKRFEQQVLQHGGFLTDFWSDINFNRNNFLKRNRIIAGLSQATIVIESAEKGGSLVTADIANSYNREVFTIPGRPTDKQSVGCNNLVKKQQAQLITSAADLIYYLGWEVEEQKPKQTQLFVELTSEEETVMQSLRELGKTELDVLALSCKLPVYQLSPILLNLELNGLVRPLPGKMYEAI